MFQIPFSFINGGINPYTVKGSKIQGSEMIKLTIANALQGGFQVQPFQTLST